MFVSYSPVLREHYENDEAFDRALATAQAEVLNGLRSARDKFLAASDWTQFNDSPLSAEMKSAWAVYRQALRDITQATINWESEFVIDNSYFPAKPEAA